MKLTEVNYLSTLIQLRAPELIILGPEKSLAKNPKINNSSFSGKKNL